MAAENIYLSAAGAAAEPEVTESVESHAPTGEGGAAAALPVWFLPAVLELAAVAAVDAAWLPVKQRRPAGRQPAKHKEAGGGGG